MPLSHQQKYFLSPSDSVMTDSTAEFYNIRKQQKKKQFNLLSKSRRGMRPMRSSSQTTIVSTISKNKTRSRYNSMNSTSSSVTLCSQNSSNFFPCSIPTINSSVFELGPKKGNLEI
jgi:hypothetical protein